MAAKKETLSNALLNAVLRNVSYTSPASVFCGLYTTAPTSTAAGTEVSGGSYARQAVTFSAAASGATSNSGAVTFPVASASWGTVTAAAISDAVSAGNQLYFGNLGTPKAVGIGDQLNFAIAALAVTEN
jgi:hypothetical protein